MKTSASTLVNGLSGAWPRPLVRLAVRACLSFDAACTLADALLYAVRHAGGKAIRSNPSGKAAA